MAISLSGDDPRGPRRGAKGSCGTPGTPELAALLKTGGADAGVRPVVRAVRARVLGIVGAEHDDDDVPLRCSEGFVLWSLECSDDVIVWCSMVQYGAVSVRALYCGLWSSLYKTSALVVISMLQ